MLQISASFQSEEHLLTSLNLSEDNLVRTTGKYTGEKHDSFAAQSDSFKLIISPHQPFNVSLVQVGTSQLALFEYVLPSVTLTNTQFDQLFPSSTPSPQPGPPENTSTSIGDVWARMKAAAITRVRKPPSVQDKSTAPFYIVRGFRAAKFFDLARFNSRGKPIRLRRHQDPSTSPRRPVLFFQVEWEGCLSLFSFLSFD
jgi:hypothetical protein